MTSNYNYHGDVVVFDLDDTLLRERNYARSGFQLIENILLKDFPDAAGISGRLSEILGQRGRYFDFLENFLIEKEGNSYRLPNLIDIYRHHIPKDLPASEGAIELLTALNDRRVKTGIITDGRSGTQRAKIKSLDIERFLEPELIVISEESGKDKSAPDNFRRFVTLYPEAKRFFYIADNERKDFLIPNLLGWTTLKVPYNSDNVHEDFINPDKLSQPAFILTNLMDFIIIFDPEGE